jgi:hypothetical protein
MLLNFLLDFDSVMTRPLTWHVVASGGRVFEHSAAAQLDSLICPNLNCGRRGVMEISDHWPE